MLEMARTVKSFGYLLDKTADSVSLRDRYGVANYTELKYFPFTSDRMASSCLIKDGSG